MQGLCPGLPGSRSLYLLLSITMTAFCQQGGTAESNPIQRWPIEGEKRDHAHSSTFAPVSLSLPIFLPYQNWCIPLLLLSPFPIAGGMLLLPFPMEMSSTDSSSSPAIPGVVTAATMFLLEYPVVAAATQKTFFAAVMKEWN